MMGTVDILSRLRAKKSSDGQSRPPYPQSNFDHNGDVGNYYNHLKPRDDVSLGDPPSILGSLGALVGTDAWAHINKSEVEQELMRQMAQAQMNQAAQAQPYAPLPLSSPPNRPSTGATLAIRAREMFLKRMGGIRAELRIAPEDFLHCHIYGETVYVFYCFAGRDGCAKEGIDLFPSDQLITQFRMVLAT